MKNLVFGLLLLTCHCAFAQETKVIKFDHLEKLLSSPSDKIQVVNFWATWCAPCVKELPLFEKMNQENAGVKVTLVNLDFADKLQRVNSFVSRKNIRADVLLLDEIDYNSWIDKVDKDWGGAIPATLIVNTKTGKRKFIEKELQEGELEKLVQEVQ
jgi:thiol-disulfide isomerase/thioredoxin